ncbi:MAG: hypothetical protein GY906_28190 [bacterium]|nr:hypothetical protein [bacterium]
MTSRFFLRCAAVVLGVGLVVAPAHSFTKPELSPVSAKAFQHADLYIGNVLVSPDDLGSSKSAVLGQALARLGVSAEYAKVDRRSERWGTLISSIPLIPGTGVGNNLNWAQQPQSVREIESAARAAFLSYVEDHSADLGINPAEIGGVKVTVHNNGNLIQIFAGRQLIGVPVRDSYLTATISHGNLILMGARQWGDLGVSFEPDVTKVNAKSVLETYLGSVAPQSYRKPELAIVPMAAGVDYQTAILGEGYSYRLVWILRPDFVGEIGEWEALVDAHSGDLLAFLDTANYANKQGETTREVKGGVYPVSNDGVGADGTEQAGWPMPFAYVQNGEVTRTSTTGGQVETCLNGTDTTNLAGPYLTMVDTCGEIIETNVMTAGDDLDLELGPGTDCTIPAGHSAGDTHATRSGFYELNKIIEMGRGQLPNNSFLQQPLRATMNVNDNCNAGSSAAGLTFFTSGGGCANTGELAGVFDHEWGHSMDREDATPGVSSPGEGIADIYASLRFNASCIGRNFRPGMNCGGYGDPCLDCSGVRDIDWNKRASQTPHDLDWIDANCTGGGAPCGGSVHCEGSVYAETVWDLWNREFTATGMDLDSARETATRLTFIGSGAVGTWYSCSNGSGGDGCNADGGYLNYLAADDDDGNLANGTPHMQDIYDAFNVHGIACATPAVSVSGCAGGPTAAATNLVATAQDRGVALTWDAVTGATRYKVYRTEGVHGCAFGKSIIAETTSTSFVDDFGLMNGREYFYSIVAFSTTDACHGAMTSCSSATPTAGANLALDAATSTTTLFGGDGDAFFDNCEEAELTFDVSNIGTGSLTNVSIVSITSPTHPEVLSVDTLPLQVSASLDACGIAQGVARVRGVGMSHNDTVQVDIEVSADELSGSRTVSLEIPFVESDATAVASQTFSFEADYEGWNVFEGTFDRNGSQGGSPGTMALNSSNALNDQCDRVRSPVVIPTATTTLSLSTNYEIEGQSGGIWYDRANVALVESDGSRTYVDPDGGRLYDVPEGSGNYSGCNDPEAGWAGTQNSWASSTFTATALDSAGLAGNLMQVEMTYSTDPLTHLRGFAFDGVTLTDFELQVPDTQTDCTADSIFADGFESGSISAWDSSKP